MSTTTLRGTNRKRTKKSGFRSRMKTKSGRRVVNCRRRKKRKKVAVAS